MRDRLIGLLERADLALASCVDVIDEDELAPLVEAVQAVRTRTAYPDDMLVLALAGGTGSGKSSLFNVLTGEDLVDVGGVRPTTSRPAAAVPAAVGSSMDGYLDRLGVAERHVYEGGALCLIDMPDTDSVDVEHRHRVDRLLPLVDVVIWVTDPEKYRDARLHDDYLKPMSAYSGQFVFVINQIDRLTEAEVEDVSSDLEAALEENWMTETMILPVSASPPSGPAIGIEGLLGALEDKRRNRQTLYGKLLTDLSEASQALSAMAGSSLDFDARAGEAVESAASLLTEGNVTEAGDQLTGLLDALAMEAGGVTSTKLEAIAAELPAHLARIEERLPTDEAPRRWEWVRRRRGSNQGADRREIARSQLSEAVIRPARATLARRAVAVAAVAEFALEVENLRSTTRR